ncbi:MAG: hydrogen peroxide-inducible genes activator [Pseudomonadota bacterium]
MALTVRQLQFFQALVQERHFGRAAQRMGVTQPALSIQIKQLEEHFGFPLFERERGAIALTAAGERLLPRVDHILLQLIDLEQGGAADDAVLEQRFDLGIIPTVAPYLLPNLLPALKDEFPKLQLQVKEGVTEQLFSDVTAGSLHAVVAAEHTGDRNLESIPLFTDPFYIASGRDASDVIASPAAQDSVAIERLLLLDDGHCLRDQALAVCNATGERRLLNFGATSMTTILQLVANGMGITLLPAIAVETEANRLDGISLTDFQKPAPSRSIALFFRPSSARRHDIEALANEIRTAAQPLLDAATAIVDGAQRAKTRPPPQIRAL